MMPCFWQCSRLGAGRSPGGGASRIRSTLEEGQAMTHDDFTGVRYTYDQRPAPSLMNPKYTQPGRKWIPLV